MLKAPRRSEKIGAQVRSSAGPSALNLLGIPNHALTGVAIYCRAFGPLQFRRSFDRYFPLPEHQARRAGTIVAPPGGRGFPGPSRTEGRRPGTRPAWLGHFSHTFSRAAPSSLPAHLSPRALLSGRWKGSWPSTTSAPGPTSLFSKTAPSSPRSLIGLPTDYWRGIWSAGPARTAADPGVSRECLRLTNRALPACTRPSDSLTMAA